jgi:ADP-dependent NAD(P)H-hydrate dehydratase / NAD(P)H-hydrate epimerase
MGKSSKVVTAAQAHALDTRARERYGVSALILMENAGRQVAQEALSRMKMRKRVVVVCGKGNNGGDGFVASRHLLCAGVKPEIFLVGRAADVRKQAGTNLGVLLALGQAITELNAQTFTVFKKAVCDNALVIDALLGVGLKGNVTGLYKEVIDMVNASGAYVLSVDIPAGLHADTGEMAGVCVRADATLTFAARKKGMVMGNGPRYCGRIIVGDLGVPFTQL